MEVAEADQVLAEGQAPKQEAPSTLRVVKPETLQEFSAIGNALGNNEIVFLNMEEIDDHVAFRLIDMLNGVVFGKHAKMQRVSHNTYLISPSTVETDGFY